MKHPFLPLLGVSYSLLLSWSRACPLRPPATLSPPRSLLFCFPGRCETRSWVRLQFLRPAAPACLCREPVYCQPSNCGLSGPVVAQTTWQTSASQWAASLCLRRQEPQPGAGAPFQVCPSVGTLLRLQRTIRVFFISLWLLSYLSLIILYFKFPLFE